MQQCLTEYIFYVQFFLTECYFAEVCERGQLILHAPCRGSQMTPLELRKCHLIEFLK